MVPPLFSQYGAYPLQNPGAGVGRISVILAAVTIACVDAPSAEIAGVERSQENVDSSNRSSPTLLGISELTRYTTPGSIDEQFLHIALDAPEFAGIHIDADHVATVSAVDISDQARLLAVLEPTLAQYRTQYLISEQPAAFDVVRFRQVKYSFRELFSFYADTLPLWSDYQGITTVDVDELANVLSFGVGTDSDALVLGSLLSTAMPQDAFRVAVVGEPVLLGFYVDTHRRPAEGGVKITHDPNGFGWCTLGYNGYSSSLGKSVFITADHCAGEWSTSDMGELWGQPDRGWFDSNVLGPIAIEKVAVYVNRPDCPTSPNNWFCKNSDAVAISYNNANDSAFKKLARTPGANDRWITEVHTINQKGLNAVVGTVVTKTGAHTGSTTGTVSSTCANVDQSTGFGNHRFFCQVGMSSMYSQQGDSGAPVFSYSGGSATLYGVLWTKVAFTSYYSPHANVELDLGAIAVF